MAGVLQALFAIGAVIAVGVLLGRREVLGAQGQVVLARVVFVVATPALMVTTLAHADLGLLVSRQAAVTWSTSALVAAVVALVLRLGLRRSGADTVVGTFSASYVNAGNLGVPLAVYMLGDAVYVVPSLLFQLLVLAPVGFVVLDGARSRLLAAEAAAQGLPAPTGPGGARAALRRTATNPIILGTLAGLLLAVLPWDLPEPVFTPFQLLGAAAAPMALLTFGMALARPRTVADRAPRPDLVLAVAARSVVHPALALLAGHLLGLDAHHLLVVVAMASLPTAQNVLVYATAYRHGQALARDAGLVTTVLCVPLLLGVAALLG